MIPEPRSDITAKVIASSITRDGRRIDTLQLRYPRIIHAEFMTHRVISRNASSSRAIPTASILVRDEDMFIPQFKRNKPGMSPGDYLSYEDQKTAEAIWVDAAKYCITAAQLLSDKKGLNIHKQWANRLLEWFGYIDVLATATTWTNFDHLRDHEAAQDEIRILCRAMQEARNEVTPRVLRNGEWHLPYIDLETDYSYAHTTAGYYADRLKPIFDGTMLASLDMADKLMLVGSAARACRLSYSKLDGTPTTFEDDIERFTKLVPINDPVHASPLEHQATPYENFFPKSVQGNFQGFAQFRKFIPQEAV